MDSPIIDRTVDAEALRALRDHDMIDAKSYWKGMRYLRPDSNWVRWCSGFFLILGVSLVLAGIVFFFAYNWEGLSKWSKLGILQGAVMIIWIASLGIGMDRLFGKLLILSASTLAGVCFAVFGQVYQTGADAFGFFLLWAITILPWVLAARFAPLWALWLILMNLACWFFWDQVGQFYQQLAFPYIAMVLAVLNGSAFVLSQTIGRKVEWLQSAWIRPFLLIVLLVSLTAPLLWWIVGAAEGDELLSCFLSALLWMAAVGPLFVYYNRVDFQATELSILLVDAKILLLFLVGRILVEADVDEIGLLFLMALTTIGASAGLLTYVRQRMATFDLRKADSR